MQKSTEIINGKPRIVATLEIPWGIEKIVKDGKEEEIQKVSIVKIKKLNFGEFNEIQRASMKVTMFGNQPKLDLDSVAMNEQSILKSVIDAPFQVNDINIIRELDRELAEIILGFINELNMSSDKKKEN